MKLFKRRHKTEATTVIPEEIQAYSQAENREKMGIAALVGFVSLLLTLVVLFGLFIGGKWMYRKIAGPKPQSNTTTAVEKSENTPQNSEDRTVSTGNSETSTSPSQQSETSSAPTPTVPVSPGAATAPTSTYPTLPRTGPELDL
jgi:cytoskeletal protein RodZ